MYEPAPTPVVAAPQERETPWGLGDAILAVIAVLVAEIVGAVLLGTIGRAIGGPNFLTRNALALNILAYQFLVLGVLASAIWLTRVRHRSGLRSLGYCFPDWQTVLTPAVIGVAAVFLGSAIITALFNRFFPQFGLRGNATQVLAGVHAHMPLIVKIVIVLWAGVEAPLAEETLFRGIVFQGLRRSFGAWLPHAWAIAGAAVSSGLLFGLAHFEPHTLPILFAVGVILAYVFQYGRSIVASVLVHAALNTTVVIYVLQSTR